MTGGYSGCGFEFVRILFSLSAIVYIAGRDATKYDSATEKLKSEFPFSKGRLEFPKLDLADLTTIKTAVEQFTAREGKLHVLTNNAGVNAPPAGSKTAQVKPCPY